MAEQNTFNFIQTATVLLCLLHISKSNNLVTVSREEISTDKYQLLLRDRHKNTICATMEQVYSCNVSGEHLRWELIDIHNTTIVDPLLFVRDDDRMSVHLENFTFSDLYYDGTNLSMRLTIMPSLDLNMTTVRCHYSSYSDELIHIIEGHRMIERPRNLRAVISRKNDPGENTLAIYWNQSNIYDFGYYKLEIWNETYTLLIYNHSFYDNFTNTTGPLSLTRKFTGGRIHVNLYVVNWCNISSDVTTLNITFKNGACIDNEYTNKIFILVGMFFIVTII